MIRRPDEHGIDVLAVEDAAVVADDVEVERLARGRHPLIEPGLVHFAGRDVLDTVAAGADEGVEDTGGAIAAADDRHANPAVRALPTDNRARRRHGQRRC